MVIAAQAGTQDREYAATLDPDLRREDE